MSTMLLQLREAARAERDSLVKFNLKKVADELDTAIKTFGALPISDNLSAVNGLWARAVRQLGFASGPTGDGGKRGAGLKEGAKLTEAA